ncbi:hypothetical protein ABL78_0416 [Leptomonas seymouri]|uniref:Coiled-coil domain-containing protein 6 n=1 Tax=Leptomonas seymouri TaxID=5684 RepID=A0A0N0P8Y4_LEPSE|nr:hypothetical protein ABL78_0416 [Leptomonas seymouri]|eukprot:KPI90486.1 hypothetical protein ABL78_0416 [Leptomonas seymouri]
MTSFVSPRTDALLAVQDMSIGDLRREYISLKSTGYSLSVEETHLKDKIEVLREESVRAEFIAEVKEEQMSNQLFRRLDGAEKEVQRYKAMLKEEESEADALTDRIKQMRSEKNEVENVLEERQEYLLMNLQRKLLETARKKSSVEQELMLEQQRYLEMLMTRLDALRGRSTASSADSSTLRFSAAAVGNASLPSSTAAGSERPPDALHGSGGAATASDVGAAAEFPLPVKVTSFSTLTPEKASCNEATLPAPAFKSPYTSFTKGSAKDAELSGTLHPAAVTPNARAGFSSVPRSGDLAQVPSHSSETHQAVVALEQKLNQLLLEQAAAMQRTSATEKQCAELGAKLRAVQEATFLDRARAAKLKDDLREVRARLTEANSTPKSTTNASTLGDSSFDDSVLSSVNSRSFDTSASLTMNNLSLRERTRELLSSIPPPPMN